MEFQQNKKPIFLIVAGILVFGVALAYGYFFSQLNATKAELASVEAEIAQAGNQLQALKKSDSVLAQRAVNSLEQITDLEVEWSKVLDLLNRITPIDLVEKEPIIEFISYSGAENGKLSFNVRTQASENVEKLLDAVSTTINIFNETPDFSNPFVPSISKSVNNNDQTLLTFILTAAYTPSSADRADDKDNEIEPVIEDTGETIPRR